MNKIVIVIGVIIAAVAGYLLWQDPTIFEGIKSRISETKTAKGYEYKAKGIADKKEWWDERAGVPWAVSPSPIVFEGGVIGFNPDTGEQIVI